VYYTLSILLTKPLTNFYRAVRKTEMVEHKLIFIVSEMQTCNQYATKMPRMYNVAIMLISATFLNCKESVWHLYFLPKCLYTIPTHSDMTLCSTTATSCPTVPVTVAASTTTVLWTSRFFMSARTDKLRQSLTYFNVYSAAISTECHQCITLSAFC